MLKKTITYTDYDDVERTEDFYFNLTKAECTEFIYSEEGGIDKMIKRAVQEKDNRKIVEIFKKLIEISYGEKSPDGRRFIKSKELSEAFMQTEAYSNLFVELSQSETEAIKFVKGILPKDIASEVKDTPNQAA